MSAYPVECFSQSLAPKAAVVPSQFGSAQVSRSALRKPNKSAVSRSGRSVYHPRVGRCVTYANIVESKEPSMVDRILKVFQTPADSLNEGIATFYDESSALWENMWGEHMHHGYYEVGQPVKDHREAQVDMVENALKWAEVESAENVLDVGCGIGGSSRHMARKFGCAATGITLSPKQAARANAITAEAVLPNVTYQVADALNQPFADNTFDFVWSMESGEHMPDKTQFLKELTRVCKPGGKILIVTWCHRTLEEGEAALRPDEQTLLDNICDAYYLPAWCSIADYKSIASSLGLQEIKTGDWTAQVQPFWGAVIQTALTPAGFSGLLKAGAGTIR
eukprot:CAMPEP_0118924248 /NCGR_PEP_ID=MMETSP1169-20130426/2470_1 /TAXON_ID=36882 /ORGANISM="Pyramimonas obovata, Strain CCMP722" /LENGTH=335 /DNA_ID=CAMNT_0006865341 /DNA_START=51 /DNA_END=1054 /DNA_ORIENTATION=+